MKTPQEILAAKLQYRAIQRVEAHKQELIKFIKSNPLTQHLYVSFEGTTKPNQSIGDYISYGYKGTKVTNLENRFDTLVEQYTQEETDKFFTQVGVVQEVLNMKVEELSQDIEEEKPFREPSGSIVIDDVPF